MKTRSLVILAALVLLAAGAAATVWWRNHQNDLPDYIASGNGRIEAEEVHVATKYAGRVAEVLVNEGDMVAAGQVLARMDTSELRAELAAAKASIAQAQENVVEARAQIIQRESELKFAEQELERADTLVQKGHISQQQADQKRTDRETAQAALDAARARLASTQAAVEAAKAQAERIETQIADSTLTAPRAGRVQYRLAEPGEVLPSGGRVVTLLDLTDVYMTIFLSTADIGRLLVGNEARIILDAVPQYVIPAAVSFISAEAQFTPREVETRSEREKLMFRVKVKVAPELLREHIHQVRTGLPGEAYVMLGGGSSWPERFTVNLPPVAAQ
ncbi:MAG: HlyD family efflux transporter periplasmic adaptor subunit [Kiloniellaceae bacterium]